MTPLLLRLPFRSHQGRLALSLWHWGHFGAQGSHLHHAPGFRGSDNNACSRSSARAWARIQEVPARPILEGRARWPHTRFWPSLCSRVAPTPQNIVTGTTLRLGVTCGCDHDRISSPPSLCFLSPITTSLLGRCFSLSSSRSRPGFPPRSMIPTPGPVSKIQQKGSGVVFCSRAAGAGLTAAAGAGFPSDESLLKDLKRARSDSKAADVLR